MRRIASLFIAVAALAFGTTVTSAHSSHSKSGSIRFGKALHGKIVVHATTKFKVGKPIAWRAYPKGRASKKLTFQLIQETGPGTFPAVVWKSHIKGLKGMFTVKQLKSHKLKAATFEMDIHSGKKLVAKGRFQIQSKSGSGHVGY